MRLTCPKCWQEYESSGDYDYEACDSAICPKCGTELVPVRDSQGSIIRSLTKQTENQPMVAPLLSFILQPPLISWGWFMRFCIAIVVACISSCITLLIIIAVCIRYNLDDGMMSGFAMSLAAFNGVFLGSLCLNKKSRSFGSLLIVVLGVLLCSFIRLLPAPLFIPLPGEPGYTEGSEWHWLVFVYGGMVAVIFFFIRSQQSTLLPVPRPPSTTPATPTSSDYEQSK